MHMSNGSFSHKVSKSLENKKNVYLERCIDNDTEQVTPKVRKLGNYPTLTFVAPWRTLLLILVIEGRLL